MMEFGCALPGGSYMPQGIGAVPEDPLSSILHNASAVSAQGFDYSEVSAGLISELSEEDMRELEGLCHEGRLTLRAGNSFIPQRLSLFDASKASEREAYVDLVLGRCRRLGIEVMAFGSGGARRIPDGLPREEGLEVIEDFLRLCGRYGQKHGVTIVIEPLNHTECNVLTSVGESASIVRQVGSPRVQVMADVFHMAYENEDLSVLRENIDILAHVHVSVPGPRTCPRPGEQNAYLLSFARELKAAGYDRRVSIECQYRNFKEDIKGAIVFLKEAFS